MFCKILIFCFSFLRLVNADIVFYENNMKALKGVEDVIEGMQTVWTTNYDRWPSYSALVDKYYMQTLLNFFFSSWNWDKWPKHFKIFIVINITILKYASLTPFWHAILRCILYMLDSLLTLRMEVYMYKWLCVCMWKVYAYVDIYE